jgi:hypothetical protein
MSNDSITAPAVPAHGRAWRDVPELDASKIVEINLGSSEFKQNARAILESAKTWGELRHYELFRPHDDWQTAAASGHRA